MDVGRLIRIRKTGKRWELMEEGATIEEGAGTKIEGAKNSLWEKRKKIKEE